MDLRTDKLKNCVKFFGLYCFAAISVLTAADLQQTNRPQHDFVSHWSIGLESEQIADGWLALFDGESLFGWRNHNVGDWRIKNKTLVGSGAAKGLLRTAVQFDDYELRFNFKVSTAAKCDLLIRTSPVPRNPQKDCYSIGLGDRQKESQDEQWNSLRLTANGDQLNAWINNRAVSISGSDERLRKGYIGFNLQAGDIELRNIVLLPLNAKSVFNGNDLSGWKIDNKLDSQFFVENGMLNMTGGRGQIETKGQFADFVFSIHGRTNSVGLNSGVFFRCIPGDIMNGYESQIQNQFKNDDRTEPVDCGTGGVFRRQNVRFINSDDQSWFAKTIVADGGTFCIWVNGLLVADWSDQRRRHENPRNGRRLKAGTVILQGHDPTTNLSFKKMFVRELNPRRAN